jgi:AraC-like DNA-binding protein
MDVLFVVGESRARVIGPMTRAIVTREGTPSCTVGVRFRPGAALDVLDIAARELRDGSVEVAHVWGREGRSLDARLAEARSAREAIAALETALLCRVARLPRPDRRIACAVALVQANGGELPIPAVATHVGLGERQLERLFLERVGYGPKAFARVVRLQRAIGAIARGSIASWARLALSCGYSDQAHLVREFRALTGVTPLVYASSHSMSEIDNPASDPLATVDA